MRTLMPFTLIASLLAATSAQADFKIAEFTFGQSGSTKTTVVQSIKKYQSPKVEYVKTGLTDAEIQQMLKNIGLGK